MDEDSSGHGISQTLVFGASVCFIDGCLRREVLKTELHITFQGWLPVGSRVPSTSCSRQNLIVVVGTWGVSSTHSTLDAFISKRNLQQLTVKPMPGKAFCPVCVTSRVGVGVGVGVVCLTNNNYI